MPRMTESAKREWALFINPTTGRKNYNQVCRKCTHKCKQSYRVIVVRCRRFDPIWASKDLSECTENGEK